MSIDDAIMEMETSKNRFVIYRDSSTENVNVIYRRDDGKFALLEISQLSFEEGTMKITEMLKKEFILEELEGKKQA